MSPLTSWLFLAAVIAVFVGPTWLVCRRAERRHVPFCVCDRCMAESTTWNPTNANDRVSAKTGPVAASRPHERHRL